MPHTFREKSFCHRASRHKAEACSPVLAPDGAALTWLQVDAEAETLMLQRRAEGPAVAVSMPGLLFNPCFAGDWLLWVQEVVAE